MKVLLDTNVVLDVLLRRSPWLADAETIRQASAAGRVETYMNASSVTDIYYISRRLVGSEAAHRIVRECLDSLEVLAVDREMLEHAHALAIGDFEDALQIASAERNRLDAIVTRNPSDFKGSTVPVISPSELVARL